jgi:hypothetical protein
MFQARTPNILVASFIGGENNVQQADEHSKKLVEESSWWKENSANGALIVENVEYTVSGSHESFLCGQKQQPCKYSRIFQNHEVLT